MNFAKSHRWFAAIALASTTLLAACSNTYSREDFTTAVMGKSEQEVTTAVGKPSSVEENGERATWTYNHETFDLSNQNRIDGHTTVIFEGPAGSRHATKVDFS